MRFAISFICFIALTACGGQFMVTEPVIMAATQKRDLYPRPAPVQLADIQWEVLSSLDAKTRDQFFDKEDAGFCLAPRHYENLGLNMQEIIRYLREQKALLEVYERERREDNGTIKNTLGPEGT